MIGNHGVVAEDTGGDDHGQKKREPAFELCRKTTIHEGGGEDHEARKANEYQKEFLEFWVFEESFELQRTIPLRRDRESEHLLGEIHDLLYHPRQGRVHDKEHGQHFRDEGEGHLLDLGDGLEYGDGEANDEPCSQNGSQHLKGDEEHLVDDINGFASVHLHKPQHETFDE